MNLVLWGVFAYVGAQLVVGLLVSRKISTEADYLLGGRRFGYGLLVMTIFATW
ncbi:MAG: sodium:solute symporter, partial [Candidatus Omnitrophica bacterium]|nr:sodium:solute symporter [Candidatus Omnitrophota bacterium]